MSDGAQINITLGTAGHVDHGKTALVKLFTGCETDRLKEEKERGMSIELGFAPCTVSGREVGIVDVPGHEHFIKTMVAGACGMDGVILVVAADDGIMPQTREHLDIMTLLGITHGMIALTKIDRVPPERVSEVTRDLVAFTRGTFLEGVTIVPVSSITGEGFGEFLSALDALLASIRPKSTAGVFRQPIERGFSVRGHGTVLSGIPVAGSVRIGDEVVLLPQGLTGRVNAIQVYGRDSDVAQSGQCAALNIRHWEAKGVERGDVLTAPGYFAPEMWFLLRLRMLPHEGAYVKNAMEVKFHTGTSERLATLYLMEGDTLKAGEECLAEVRVNSPLVAGPNDPFVIRTLSPQRTVGGGAIVEGIVGKDKRTREGVVEDLRERAAAALCDADFVRYALKTAPAYALREAELARRTKAPAARVADILRELAASGETADAGAAGVIHRDVLARLADKAVEALKTFHEASPESPGMTEAELQEALGVERAVFAAAVAALKGDGRLEERKGRLSLAEHRAQFSPEDRVLMDAVDSAFRKAPFAPPGEDQLIGVAGMGEKTLSRIIGLMVEHQRLVRVAPGMLFHAEAVAKAKGILVDFLKKEGRLESVKFKYLLDTTRKYAIPLLDYFDTVGVTRRHGNTRTLKQAGG